MSGILESSNANAGALPDEEQQRGEGYRRQGLWTDESLPDRYHRFVEKAPDALSVVDSRGVHYTHRQLWDGATRYMEAFAAKGIGAGDVVMIFMPNWSEWKLLFLAVQRLGAIPATLPVTTDKDTLAYMAEVSGARLLIASESFGSTPTGQTALEAASQCANALASMKCAHAQDVLLLKDEGGVEWHSIVAGEAPKKPELKALDHIMFTSSTTGLPKAVMHTADSLGAQNKMFSERFSLGEEDPVFMASPLGHAVGAIHGVRLTLHNGSTLVLQERWDPARALAMMEQYDCRFTAAATPFLKDLVELPWDQSSPKMKTMTTFICGGAQVPPQLMEEAIGQFPNTFLSVLWGMTEGGHTTCLPKDWGSEKVYQTAGRAIPGLDVCVLDAEGNPQPAGVDGELAVRGASVFRGYLGQPELYQSLLAKDGFFRTGDQGRIDDDGYVSITGRFKDLIIRGGVNVSPVRIEDVLSGHADVQAVAVVGEPDERMGERICAVIQLRGERVPTLESLKCFAGEQGLPHRMMPEFLRIVDEMPRTALGKIRKIDLQKNLENLQLVSGD